MATGKVPTMIGSLPSASALAVPLLSISHTVRTHFSSDIAGFKSIQQAMPYDGQLSKLVCLLAKHYLNVEKPDKRTKCQQQPSTQNKI